MRSIAIMNQKGGVGKTTTAVNISAALAATGAKVCLIDMDPQAHATLHFGIEPQVEFDSVYDVLVKDMPLHKVRRQVAENLWIVPAHLDLSSAEMELAGDVAPQLLLREKLQADAESAECPNFDYVFIDCPPSLGILTVNALTAVDEVFIPMQPHFLALHGLSKLLQTIDVIARRLNPRLRLSGVVFCMYDGQTRLASEVAQDINAFFEKKDDSSDTLQNVRVFQTKIRKNVRLAEAPSFGRPIFEYDPGSNGAEDYRNLAGEIVCQGQKN